MKRERKIKRLSEIGYELDGISEGVNDFLLPLSELSELQDSPFVYLKNNICKSMRQHKGGLHGTNANILVCYQNWLSISEKAVSHLSISKRGEELK